MPAPPSPDRVGLRRGLLAVSVLCDVDLVPRDDGVELSGDPPLRLDWAECARALDGLDPESPAGRDRLAGWMGARRDISRLSSVELGERARPVGFPVDAEEHPGPDWVRTRVLGGALELGLGFLGADPARPEHVLVVRPGVLSAAGHPARSSAAWWAAASAYLAEMGAMAAARWRRRPGGPIRPMGDCDVVTLLGSATLRAALCAGSQGMCAMAVPMRTRGWLELSRIDPAFAVAAAAATEPAERGFRRPLLVTAEEVVETPPGGRPAQIVLRDPAAHQPWPRDVLYR